jgi:lipopolysaccharide/colanic/teichoic acid biosynthesis glycosyltransferase
MHLLFSFRNPHARKMLRTVTSQTQSVEGSTHPLTHPLLMVRNAGMEAQSSPWPNSPGKRLVDVGLAGLVLLLSAPVFVVIALLIKLTSRGPIFFSQMRVGKGRVPFLIHKFRTMHAGHAQPLMVTHQSDSRITVVGRVLRRFKLDELPQLYNVLRGDMSFVGPRPKVVGHERYELKCKPGITGAATLVFAHEGQMLARIPGEDLEAFVVDVLHRIKAGVDQQYESESTFATDLKILIETPLHITGLKHAGLPEGVMSGPEIAAAIAFYSARPGFDWLDEIAGLACTNQAEALAMQEDLKPGLRDFRVSRLSGNTLQSVWSLA